MRRVSAAPCTSAMETALLTPAVHVESSWCFTVAHARALGLPQRHRADTRARTAQHARQFCVDVGRDVFRCGIDLVEGWSLVEVMVIEGREHLFRRALDRLEVETHADFVECGGDDLDLHLPIMAVQAAALAGIVPEKMGGGEVGDHLQCITGCHGAVLVRSVSEATKSQYELICTGRP